MKKNEPEGAFLENIHADAITMCTILELSTSAIGFRLAASAEPHLGSPAMTAGRAKLWGYPFFLSLPWRSDNGCPTSGHSTFQVAPASDVPP
jgi:hypothetical protein